MPFDFPHPADVFDWANSLTMAAMRQVPHIRTFTWNQVERELPAAIEMKS